MSILHYWQEHFFLEHLFQTGVLDPKIDGLKLFPKEELDQDITKYFSSFSKTETIILAPWFAIDRDGNYVVPLLLRYRYQEQSNAWCLEQNPTLWVPFALFDSNATKPPLGEECDYEHAGWQDFTVDPAKSLILQVKDWLRHLFPKLGKERQAQLGLVLQSSALYFSQEGYLNNFPLLKNLLELPLDSKRAAAYFLSETPTSDIIKTSTSFSSNIAKFNQEEASIAQEILPIEEGQLRALRTPIGSSKISFSLKVILNAWYEYVRQEQETPVWQALLLSSPVILPVWLECLMGLQTSDTYSPWDPASRLISELDDDQIASLSLEERELSFLLAAKQPDLETAVNALSIELAATEQGIASGAILLLEYKKDLRSFLEAEKLSDNLEEEIISLQKREVHLEKNFDRIGEAIVEFERLKQQGSRSLLHFFKKTPKSKDFVTFKAKYNFDPALAPEAILPFLGTYLRDIRVKKTQVQRSLTTLYQQRIQRESWLKNWQAWWEQHRLGAIIYPGFEKTSENPLVPLDLEFYLAPLRQKLFWLAWHIEEAKALDSETKITPLLYWQDPAKLLSTDTLPLSIDSLDWLVADHATQLSLMQGCLWLKLAKRALFLGDEQQVALSFTQGTQSDFKILTSQGFIQSEEDFEDLEYRGLICSRNNAWQRAVIVQEKEWTLWGQVPRVPPLSELAAEYYLPGLQKIEQHYLEALSGEVGLQFWNIPGTSILTEGQRENPEQAEQLLDYLSSLKIEARTIAIVSPFVRQRALLKAGLSARALEDYAIEVLAPEQLQGQLYQVVILSMVLTAEDARPLYYDHGSQFWTSLCLSACRACCVAGDQRLFDSKLHSPTGKIASFLNTTKAFSVEAKTELTA